MGVISQTYQNIIKPELFKKDPEVVHDRFIKVGNYLGKYEITRTITKSVFRYNHTMLQNSVFGIDFTNPVGLSAGFDKDANLHNIMYEVGFGFMDIGSVTYKPYEGNPKPRLYRLPKSKGLVVYYGLKNDGVEEIVKRVKNSINEDFPLFISVAKTNSENTSTEEGGIEDYASTIEVLEKNRVGDIYEINISCPNTFGGEPFTTPEKLDRLLTRIRKTKVSKPMIIKMPINLEWSEFKGLVDVAVDNRVDGVVIGNLTKVRDPKLIKDDIPENVDGGISGLPTQKLTEDLIGKTYQAYGDKLKIIGVGGIFSAEDAYRKIRLGSSLVSLITGMIFEGPQLIGDINRGIVNYLMRDGFSNISEAVGADFK